MKDNAATLLAVGVVVLIVLGVIGLSGVTGQVLDTETVKMAVTGLIGFAAGGVIGTVTK
jgi:hypothetical protein